MSLITYLNLSHVVLKKHIFLLLTSAFQNNKDHSQNSKYDYADYQNIHDRIRWQYKYLYSPSLLQYLYVFESVLPLNTASWLLGMIGDQDLSLPIRPNVNF